MNPIRQLRIAVTILAALVVLGTLGYSALWHVSLLDGLYMTVITLTTVGYRELRPPSPAVKLFTIVLIVLGASTVAWAARAAAEMAVGDQFRLYFGKRQMDQMIARLKDHTIICGFGRMGSHIAADIARAGRPYIVLDPNPEVLERMQAQGCPYLAEDAASEAVLKRAGIERARDLVTVAPTDADNIFIVLTARGLSESLYIVARSTLVENEHKIYRAGANRVISPYVLGGRRMAAAVLHPEVVDFLDVVTGHDTTEMEISAVHVTPSCGLAKQSLQDVNVQERFGVSVVALKRDGVLGMAPEPDTVLHAGDVLLVIGPTAQVEELRQL